MNRISVVIPTIQGRENYLEMAVNSVLEQSLRAYEILIVGNTTIRFESNPLVKQIFTGRRQNAAEARNEGLKLSTGEVIAFLDDDDLWDRNYLFESVEFLFKERLDAVFGQIWRFMEDNPEKCHQIKRENDFKSIYYHNPGIIGSNIVAWKASLETIKGFREGLTVSQDKALAIDLARAGFRLGFSNGKCLLRDHSNSRLTDNRSQLLGTIQFMKTYWKEMSYLSKVRNLQRINALNYAINAERYRLGLKALFKLLVPAANLLDRLSKTSKDFNVKTL